MADTHSESQFLPSYEQRDRDWDQEVAAGGAGKVWHNEYLSFVVVSNRIVSLYFGPHSPTQLYRNNNNNNTFESKWTLNAMFLKAKGPDPPLSISRLAGS